MAAAVAFAMGGVVGATPEPAPTRGVVQLVRQAPTPAPELPAQEARTVQSAEPAAPVHLRIGAIGISVPIVPVGLARDQTLELPAAGTAGWYDLGLRPGEPGYAVIAGHLDTRQGPDVFRHLRDLKAGDAISVTDAASIMRTFRVESVEQHAKGALLESRMWQASDRPMLTLVTCGGAFDRENLTYMDNVVVYAAAADGPTAPRKARGFPTARST